MIVNQIVVKQTNVSQEIAKGYQLPCSVFTQIDCLLSSCFIKSFCYVWTFNQNVTKACVLVCFI